MLREFIDFPVNSAGPAPSDLSSYHSCSGPWPSPDWPHPDKARGQFILKSSHEHGKAH